MTRERGLEVQGGGGTPVHTLSEITAVQTLWLHTSFHIWAWLMCNGGVWCVGHMISCMKLACFSTLCTALCQGNGGNQCSHSPRRQGAC